MRFRVLSMSIVALAIVAGSALLHRPGARAQDRVLVPSEHPCAGAWSVAVDIGPDLPSLPLLFTFAADGTASGSLPNPRRSVPGGAEFEAEVLEDSGMHGVWAATGDRSCGITLRFFTSSSEGEFLVATTLNGALEVDPSGYVLAAEATLVDVDAAGDNVGSLFTKATGTRIVIEQLLEDAPGVGTPSN